MSWSPACDVLRRDRLVADALSGNAPGPRVVFLIGVALNCRAVDFRGGMSAGPQTQLSLLRRSGTHAKVTSSRLF